MRPPRRPRTGQRRDGGVRSIRADRIRYPGVDLPDTTRAGALGRDGTERLKPARDAGLALQGRLARDQRRRTRERRRLTLIAIVAVVLVSIMASGWKYTSDRRALVDPIAGTSAAATRSGTLSREAASAEARALNPRSAPTPLFATRGAVKLRLPVSAEDVTEIGFHQASFSYAMHMKSLLPYADSTDAKADRSTHRDITEQEKGPGAVLTGAALQLWRNRPGKPDTAVDIGADAGSVVYAPVTGTVVKVKRFDLYGKYPDVEIHIQPEDHPELDIVMIHIDGVTCVPGDRVTAGMTPIARIRDLDRRIGPQLKSYTRNGGTHAHIQVNDATHSSYKGLKGAIAVDGS